MVRLLGGGEGSASDPFQIVIAFAFKVSVCPVDQVRWSDARKPYEFSRLSCPLSPLDFLQGWVLVTLLSFHVIHDCRWVGDWIRMIFVIHSFNNRNNLFAGLSLVSLIPFRYCWSH